MTRIDCLDCKYYLGEFSCVAFEVIPRDILEGAPHHEVRERQDTDVVFEEGSIEELEPPLAKG